MPAAQTCWHPASSRRARRSVASSRTATIRCGRPVVPATTGNPSTRSSGSRPAARATAARSSSSSPNDGGSCSIHAMPLARSTSTGTSPAAEVWMRLVLVLPSDASVNAVPSVGCPANGSSAFGCEDPDVVALIPDGGHERRLGEPDLLREPGHGRRVHARGGIRHDAELVARERDGREHVDEPERDLHGGQYRSCYAGVRNDAGVAQWQSSSLPSWLCGFDSRHPLRSGMTITCGWFPSWAGRR